MEKSRRRAIINYSLRQRFPPDPPPKAAAKVRPHSLAGARPEGLASREPIKPPIGDLISA